MSSSSSKDKYSEPKNKYIDQKGKDCILKDKGVDSMGKDHSPNDKGLDPDAEDPVPTGTEPEVPIRIGGPQDPREFPFFGPPPVIGSEDSKIYSKIEREVFKDIEPSSVLEDMWVRDITDLIWETLRLRRIKKNLFKLKKGEGLRSTLKPLVHSAIIAEMVEGWLKGEGKFVSQVNNLLQSAGLDDEAVTAATMLENLDEVERIDRLIAQAELRRSMVLREIDRHRESVAARMNANRFARY